MAKANTRVCRYTHCLHGDKNINLDTDEFVKEGNAYYHKDCYEAKQNIQEIKKVWHDKINNLVVYSQLSKILNDLIFGEGVSSEYLLFVVNYAATHKTEVRLNYPPGLKYVVGRKAIRDAYNKSKAQQYKVPQYTTPQYTASDCPTPKTEEPTFSFKAKKKRVGFGSILK